MKKHYLFLIALALFALGKGIAQTYLPVATVGYSLDGIAENTTAVSTTGGPLDNSDMVLYSQFYGTIYGGGAVGIPNNGLIASGTRTYQLQSYTGFNSMRINANMRDTIEFVNPQAYPSISLLSFATQGAATMSITVRFTDNSTQVFNAIPLADWFTANPAIISGCDRATRLTGVPAYVGSAGNPRMFGTDLAISCTNQGKPIKRIIIQNNSIAIVCIMAVAGQVPAYSVSGPPSVCSGSSATLTANGFTSYTWQPVGGFGGSNSGTVTVSPTAPTTYTLDGTDINGCSGQTVVTVNVNGGLPTLSLAGSSQTVCLGSAATITVSGASTYTLGSPAANGGTFVPGGTTTYTVAGANACGTSTAATTVSVEALPSVVPSASSSTLCAGGSLTLTATGTATGYVWSGGSAPAGNGVGFFPPASTTSYSVVGTNSLGCSAMATIPVTVHATPLQVPVVTPSIVCIGNSATLTAIGATSYTWMSSTQTSNLPFFVVTPTGTGVTTYTVIKANSTCSDSKTISVTTNALPNIFAIATPPLLCALQPATLAIGGGISYTWTAPGTPNFTFTGANPIVYPATSTNYTAAASDGTCISITTVSVTTNPNPTITTSPTSPTLCVGQQVTVTASGANNYTWTVGTNTSTGAQIIDTPTTAIAYNVTGDNNFGCTASAQQLVLVYANPTIAVAMAKTLTCSGDPLLLTASGAQSYTWDPGAGGALTHTVTVNPMRPNSGVVVYTVSGSYTATGCQSSKTVQVAVYVPTLNVTGTFSTCSGGQISLTAGGGNPNTYTWSTGSLISTFPSLTTTLSAAAVFTVGAKVTSLTVICPATQTVAVGIYPNPIITATAERSVVCPKESTQLYGGGGVSYSWSNSQTGGTITVSPQSQTNNYIVTGTDNNGCVSTGSVQVKLLNCTGIEEHHFENNGILVYPNPSNGAFTIRAESEITLTLATELGQVIRTITLSQENGYTASVTDLAKGIYFVSGQSSAAKTNFRIVLVQ